MSTLDDRPLIADPEPFDPEVLIEEARTRQRRRRAGLAGLVAALVVVGAIFALTGGGGRPSERSPTGFGHDGGWSVTATWHELSAPNGAFPAGADVSDVVRYRGEFVATGSSDVINRGGIGCPANCGTVVWASRNGRHWRVTLAAQQNNGGNALVQTRRGLALLSPGIESVDAGLSLSRHANVDARPGQHQ
jgi:hypothetical protein